MKVTYEKAGKELEAELEVKGKLRILPDLQVTCPLPSFPEQKPRCSFPEKKEHPPQKASRRTEARKERSQRLALGTRCR